MTLEWLFVACCGMVIWSSYVIIVERTCTSESMNPRPCFLALQYRLCSLLSLATLLFLLDYKYLYLLSILHLYHHLFAELVHLYNLPLYWLCWWYEVAWTKRDPILGGSGHAHLRAPRKSLLCPQHTQYNGKLYRCTSSARRWWYKCNMDGRYRFL